MIVAGQTENLESVFNASVLKRFVQALDVPWRDFAGMGSSVPLVLSRKMGVQVRVIQQRPITDYEIFPIGEQSREISGLHGTNCHSKVCVWFKGLRCVDSVRGCRCFAVFFLT